MQFISVILCCFSFGYMTAQNFKQDFLEVYNYHKDRDNYTQNVAVSSFEKKGDTKPVNQEQGKIVRGNQAYYSKFAGQETIINGTRFLFVNHIEKRMTYYHDVDIDVNQLAQAYQQGLDSVDQDRIKYLGSEGNYKKYQIHNPKEMIKTIEITLNMKAKMVTQIVYYYQKMNAYESTLYKTIIDYQIETTKLPSKDWFEIEKYISIKGKKASLNTAYKKFDLTQRQEKTINLN